MTSSTHGSALLSRSSANSFALLDLCPFNVFYVNILPFKTYSLHPDCLCISYLFLCITACSQARAPSFAPLNLCAFCCLFCLSFNQHTLCIPII